MTISEALEVESTFEVGPDLPVPSASAFSPMRADPPVVHDLSATYYDTADLSLTRHRVTLRRRTGGDDDGWHLKLPTPEGRLELHAALGDDIPPTLLAAVAGLVRRRPLSPIVRIDNHREVHLLRDAGGTPVIEFSDDRVSTESFLDGGSASRWREWEAEIVDPEAPGAHDRLADVAEACLAAGGVTSSSSSKLARAVGPLPDPLGADDGATPVRLALARDLHRLLDHDPGARRCTVTGVHQMRVAVRGLRSTLRSYLPELAALTAGTDTDTELLASELRLLAGVLGAVRDLQVVRARLETLMAEYPGDVVSHQTRQRVRTELHRDLERAATRLTATLGSDRYLDLLDGLHRLVDTHLTHSGAPQTGRDQPVDAALVAVDRQFTRFRRAHKRARKGFRAPDQTQAGREELAHSVRKRAKGLRRNVGALADAGTTEIGPLREACHQLHTLLGEVQDSVTTRQWIRRISRRAATAGDPTFGYGVLFERERSFSEQMLEGYEGRATDVIRAYREFRDVRRPTPEHPDG